MLTTGCFVTPAIKRTSVIRSAVAALASSASASVAALILIAGLYSGCTEATVDNQTDPVCTDALKSFQKINVMPDTSDFWHLFRNDVRLADTGATFTTADIGACLIVKYQTDGVPAADSMFIRQGSRYLISVARAAEPALFAVPIQRLFETALFDASNSATVDIWFRKLDMIRAARITLRR